VGTPERGRVQVGRRKFFVTPISERVLTGIIEAAGAIEDYENSDPDPQEVQP